MKLLFTKTFVRDYRKLPQEIQKAIEKQLDLLLANPKHPSLNIKKMQDPRDIWEGRVTESYRFTFQIEEDIYILRKVGTHDVLRKPQICYSEYNMKGIMLTRVDILNLSISERIQLAQDIWDSVAEVPESVTLTEEQKAELDHRLDAYHKDPNAGSPWNVVRERLAKRNPGKFSERR